MERKTPLYDRHMELGGKIVPFAGFLLPVQYETGVIAEHMAVRKTAGLFDVSHMGEVTFTGPDALRTLNRLLTNDFTNMVDGQVRYSPMCNEHGGVIDDLLLYRKSEASYLVVVNASNRFKDVEWMRSHLTGGVEFHDISDELAQIALQGPNSFKILSGICEAQFIPKKYYNFIEKGVVSGVPCLVSKTGYTGEDGFEFYCKPEDAKELWNALLTAGAPYGLIPCGLGARDTLRLEAAMPLYGHEMDDNISPLETGLDFAVKLKKEDFIGKGGIESKLPLTRKRVGLKVTGRGIAREHADVYVGDLLIGQTTSGTHSPYFGYPIAMAILKIEHTAIGTAVEIDVRGRRVAAEVVPLPFYRKS